jgi:hypothetical protein
VNAALRGDAVIEFPVTGECWVLDPPGHSRWAFDLLPLQSGSGAVAEGGWWRYLTCRLRSSNVSGWARPVGSPLDDLCGRYRLPERIGDLRGRVAMGAGAQVLVRGGRLMFRVLTPVPTLYRGLALHPDAERDPYLFRLDLSELGMSTVRVAFGREPGAGVTAMHTDLQPMQSLYKQPATGGQVEAEAEA